jgi:phosphinothricin acetyltransferase
VAEADGEVVGWLTVSAYRPERYALRFIKEVSYYVSHAHLGKRVGSALLAHAIKETERLSIKHYVAIVLDANTASIALLEKFGFKQWGHLPGIADFNGVVCGHAYYGITINDVS